MKRENISDAVGRLDEELIGPVVRLRSGQEETGREKMPVVGYGFGSKKKMRLARGLATAACLCLLCAAGVAARGLSSEPVPGNDGDTWTGDGAYIGPEDDMVQDKSGDMSGVRGDAGDVPGGSDGVPGDVSDASSDTADAASGSGTAPVDPGSLLADGDAVVNDCLMLQSIRVGAYRAVYEGVAAKSSKLLGESLGKAVDGAKGYYRLGGRDDLQYVISDNKQTGVKADSGERYLLWKFECFETKDSYPYSDVLSLIYGIKSADAVEKLIVMPPTFDNTDEGMRLQEEIGISTVKNRNDIQTFYGIISGMACYGSGHWEMIDYGNVEVSAVGEEPHDAVKKARYLTVVLDNGCEIDGLKYTAVSDLFYEYSGIAYEPLSKEQAKKVCRILGIRAE